MPRPLVPALVLCALSVLVAVSLSLWNRPMREDAAGRATATDSAANARDPEASMAAESTRAQPDPRSDDSTSARATAWSDPHRGAFEVLVVREEDESPIVGATVWGERGTASEDLGARITGADGRARWNDLAERALAIEATAPGCTTASVRLAFDPVFTARPFVVRLPAQRDVRVRLVDADGMDATPETLGFDPFWSPNLTLGLAAECSGVGQRFDTRGAPTHRTHTDATSENALAWRIEIRGKDATCVHLLLGDVVLAAMPLDPRATELAIRVEREDMHRWLDPIVVRVLEESTRAPVRGAEVLIAPHPYRDSRRTCDDAGLVRFEDLLAGEFQFTVTARGFASESVRVRRPIAGRIEVLLDVGHGVDGVVLDPDGAAKSGVVLVAYDAAELGRTARALQTVTSDVAGRFAFHALPAEEVVVVASLASAAVDVVFLPAREDLPPACQLVPCRGGAHDVVIRWVPVDPETYSRARAAADNR